MPNDGERALWQATAWQAGRPQREDLRDLTEALRRLTRGDHDLLSMVLRELCLCCPFVGVSTAMSRTIWDHNRRATFGDRVLPVLGPKAEALRRTEAA